MITVKSVLDNIEYIAALIFLAFFLANKKARTNFGRFMKEHKKQVLMFLLVIGLPFAVVTFMIFIH